MKNFHLSGNFLLTRDANRPIFPTVEKWGRRTTSRRPSSLPDSAPTPRRHARPWARPSPLPAVTPDLIRLWTPPAVQGFFRTVWTVRCGAVVYPASVCGLSGAAGLYGIRGPGPNRGHVLFGTPEQAGFPDPVSSTVCPYPSLDPARTADGGPLPPRSGGVRRGRPVALLFRGHRPDDARGAVGQRHGDRLLRRLPGQHPGQPGVAGSCALRHPGTSWFSRSRLIDRLSLPVPGPRPHCRRRPASAALRRRSARAPGSSLVSWSSPRRCARCGWPAPRRSASSTSSWPASRPARGRGPRRRARRF